MEEKVNVGLVARTLHLGDHPPPETFIQLWSNHRDTESFSHLSLRLSLCLTSFRHRLRRRLIGRKKVLCVSVVRPKREWMQEKTKKVKALQATSETRASHIHTLLLPTEKHRRSGKVLWYLVRY